LIEIPFNVKKNISLAFKSIFQHNVERCEDLKKKKHQQQSVKDNLSKLLLIPYQISFSLLSFLLFFVFLLTFLIVSQAQPTNAQQKFKRLSIERESSMH
jgi:Fe2+ transport system protein B